MFDCFIGVLRRAQEYFAYGTAVSITVVVYQAVPGEKPWSAAGGWKILPLTVGKEAGIGLI